MKFENQLALDGLKKIDDFDGKKVKLANPKNPTGESVSGEVIQAWMDINGIVKQVQIMNEDGIITWEEVSQLFIIIMEKVTEKRISAFQKIIRFVKGIFKKKSK